MIKKIKNGNGTFQLPKIKQNSNNKNPIGTTKKWKSLNSNIFPN